ncbi:MAG: S9 family peptidase [FCB group bacterium]|nr:S9 family peptidase [FCB group bacterium]
MLKKLGIFCLLITSISVAQQYEDLTLDDVFTAAFRGKYFSARWLPSEERLAFTKTDSINGKSIYSVDPLQSDTLLMVRGNDLTVDDSVLAYTRWRFSNNQERLLLETNVRKIWRHSRSLVAVIYSLNTKTLQPIANGDRVRNVKFSPDGNRVAYLKKDNNLYVYDLVREKERRLTKDGSPNIINGHFGWVYEEEFGTYDGYRWSPDGNYIAFWREDQTKVPTYPLIDYMGIYPVTRFIHYPKVGEDNPSMKIAVVDVRKGKKRWMKLESGPDVYYPRLSWIPGNSGNSGVSANLLITKLNRLQNHLQLLKADAQTGKVKTIYEEYDPAWIDITDDLIVLNDGSFLWTSEKSGFRHIYHITADGKSMNPLTSGDWEVSRIVTVDEEGGWIYFYSKRASVIGQGLDRIRLDGSDLQTITPEEGWHSVQFGPQHRLFIDRWSTAAQPTTTQLKRTDGTLQKVLMQPDTSGFKKYGFTYPRFFQIATTDDSTLLNVKMTLPRDFDPNKKYPVLMYGYGGPGSQVVSNYWSGFSTYWYQLLSQHGIILFSVDNRGTGGRGKAFKNLSYGDLGKYSAGDHMEAVKYLRTLPYVDPERIGIWGWSGGGYLTSLCLTRGADFFSMGVAVAPVIDFRLYDTIWTERYMGTLESNSAGYESANVLNYVDRFKGKLLIIHGTGDDNVHYQNTLQMINECIAKDKQIDVFFYPNRNHRISGGNTTRHLYTKITNYILTNL